MTKLNKKTRIKIEPSNRDSISSWLDVLTSMLAVSESQRLQIRDELEDHLRSRVDDLLIVGKPEPDAIQIAVGELGETAELAKLITHAHTRVNPRRKIMNAALIAVALGGMSFGGFTFFNGTGVPSATPNKSGAVPVVVPEENRADSQQKEPVVELSIEDMPMLMAIDTIADAFGFTVDIHSLNPMIVTNLQRREVSVNGLLTLNRAIQVVKMQSLQHASALTTEFHNNVIELLTYDELFRRETSVRTYSLNWSNFETAQNVFHTLQEVVGNGQYSQFFTASFIGDQLIVNARPQAHEQIDRILADSKEAYENRVFNDQAQHEVAINRIQSEFEAVRKDLLETKAKINMVENELKKLQSKSIAESAKRTFDPDIPVDQELHAQIADLTNTLDLFHFELDEIEERYMFLRSRLIESQYANLFEGLE